MHMKRALARSAATTIALLLGLSSPAAPALASDQPAADAKQETANPLTTHSRHVYDGAKVIVMHAAKLMPEEKYGFRPVETVRSFGQIVGHVADAQYMFCSAVRGERNPSLRIETTKVSKADLIAALEGAFSYCDTAWDGMTDANGAALVKAMGSDMPRLGVMQVNQLHMIEHYGNLVTYMRMNGLVPPTSDPEVMKRLGK
jgi:uncharacterized damage-inducible protein DinB